MVQPFGHHTRERGEGVSPAFLQLAARLCQASVKAAWRGGNLIYVVEFLQPLLCSRVQQLDRALQELHDYMTAQGSAAGIALYVRVKVCIY